MESMVAGGNEEGNFVYEPGHTSIRDLLHKVCGMPAERSPYRVDGFAVVLHIWAGDRSK